MTRYTPSWATKPNAIETFSRYCAPTALAAYLGVPKWEAAELLLSIPGMLYSSVGSVSTWTWRRFIKEELGGAHLDEGEIKVAHPNHNPPERLWSGPDPTVAQFLRRYPEGTFIVSSVGHTFILRDGEITGDTGNTSGMRQRIIWAARMPLRAEGLVEEEEQEWRGRQRRYAASKAKRRAKRKERMVSAFRQRLDGW